MLASGPNQQSIGIWAISIVGGESRKLRDDAWLATPSPDGAQIAYISPDYRELWVMNAYGSEARKLQTLQGATFLQVAWGPDGKRLAYLKNYSLRAERVIESCDLAGGQVNTLWADQRIKNFTWTPQGRVIATLTDENGNGSGPSRSDLWEERVRGGRAAGAPVRLTNFAGFTSLSLSVTADGKRLALIRSYDQSDVYVGALSAKASRLEDARRLTLDDRVDWPGGWSRDSRSVLFYSDRQGTLDIFRQRFDDQTAEPLSVGLEEKRQPQVSPDGSSILYLAWPGTRTGSRPAAGRILRIPISGGPGQAVLEIAGYPGSAQEPRDVGAHVLTTTGYPDFRCPAAGSCVLGESQSGKIAFTAFDAGNGRKSAGSAIDVSSPSFWDLSPDGSKIAFGETGRNDRIRIVPVGGGTASQVPVKGLREIASVGWSADGASLFVTGTALEGGTVLRHISLDGQSQVLYKTDAWLERPLASPDGHYLAFGLATSSNNVWTIENFESR